MHPENEEVHADEFWSLVALLGPQDVRGDLHRLREALVTGGEARIVGFDEQLWSAVRQLSTPEHRSRVVFDLDDPEEAAALPQSDDVAEDTALAVVSLGRRTFEAVRDDPAQLDGRWPLSAAEDLSAVVAKAYEDATGNPWVSLRPQPSAAGDRPERRTVPWLLLHADFEQLKLQRGLDWAWVKARKRPYSDKILWLREQIAPFTPAGASHADLQPTAWSSWWDAEQGQARLSCFLTFEPGGSPRHTIRSTGKGARPRTEARFVVDLSCIDGSPGDVAATARRHVDHALSTIAGTLSMPPPPPMPLTRRERQAATT